MIYGSGEQSKYEFGGPNKYFAAKSELATSSAWFIKHWLSGVASPKQALNIKFISIYPGVLIQKEHSDLFGSYQV